MANTHYITDTCIIHQSQVKMNDRVVFSDEAKDFSDFIKAAYKSLGIDYPKFYKMDNLSKLGFIAAEVLLKNVDTKQNIALVLANRSGSLDTDIKYQASIQDVDSYYPSPAVFVYTLANICAGEISIRHSLRSENIFFVSDTFDAQSVKDYADYLLQSDRADIVLCGWLELISNKYQAVLYLVQKTGTSQHNIAQIEELFLK